MKIDTYLQVFSYIHRDYLVPLHQVFRTLHSQGRRNLEGSLGFLYEVPFQWLHCGSWRNK